MMGKHGLRVRACVACSARQADAALSCRAGEDDGGMWWRRERQQHQQTIVRGRVFVSKHNRSINVSAGDIEAFCEKHGIRERRTSNSHVVLRECPFCSKPTNGHSDNLFKLYVQIGGGAYFCHRCGAKGSWYDFKVKLGGFDLLSLDGTGSAPLRRTLRPRANSDAGCLPMPVQRLNAAYCTHLTGSADNNALLYLTQERGLNLLTLLKYGVGRAVYNFPTNEAGRSGQYVPAECVTFPWIMRATEIAEQESLRGHTYDWQQHEHDHDSSTDSPTDTTARRPDIHEPPDTGEPWQIRRIKARALTNKGWQRLDPPGGGWGLFGWHTVPADAKEIVLTEGEFDAMSVYQATGLPAVSLPNGCRSLPIEVLPLLERFDKIFLWMDNDRPGQEGAAQFAKKIGINRCLLVSSLPSADGAPAPKDANEALLMDKDLKLMIDNASLLPHNNIVSFSDLKDEVLHEIMYPDKFVGVPVPSLPSFTKIIKGFRRGEMTVLTGPTGSGKTTFLSQLSLDFAEQGINVLWGSFEIKNTRLMHKMLQQYSRKPLPVGKNDMMRELELLADSFATLPLWFMKFHGGSEIDDVLDAMDYAAYVHDVEHVILDNLQFMISRHTQKSSNNSYGGTTTGWDKFEVQDSAVEKFRKFATEKNVHVTLVVHPRKELDGHRLGISSFFGSAKATQEADTVLIFQSDNKFKFVEVKKNRFDGTLGSCFLHFHRQSGRYSEQAEGVTLPTSTNIKPIATKSQITTTDNLKKSNDNNNIGNNSRWGNIADKK